MEDDAPWLMNSGYLMVCKACLMLPWVRDQRNWTGEQIDEWLTPLSYDYNGWLDEPQRERLPDLFHTYYRGLNLAQYVYGISHCVLPSGYCHPFQKERKELMQGGVDEKTADFAILMAEMSFLQAFRENPARFCREDLAVYQQIAEQEEAQQAARVPAGGYWGKLAGKAGITPDTKDQEEKQRIQDLQDQLSEAKRENEALRNELAALRKKSRKEESEREEERRISIQEHRESAKRRSSSEGTSRSGRRSNPCFRTCALWMPADRPSARTLCGMRMSCGCRQTVCHTASSTRSRHFAAAPGFRCGTSPQQARRSVPFSWQRRMRNRRQDGTKFT